MKKKLIRKSLAVILCFFSLSLSGCNEKIYSTDWTSDSEGHWHALLSHDDEGDKKDYSSHTYGDWIIVSEASETSLGKKKQVCSVCEYTHYEDIAKLEHTHKFSTEWSKDDNKHWHASTCGHDVKSNEENHTLGDWIIVTQPTEEILGSRKKVCSICNYEKIEEIAKLEHTHKYSTEWSKDDNKHWHDSTCGHNVRKDEDFHTYGEFEIVTPATEENFGSKKQICKICSFEHFEQIPKSEHVHNLVKYNRIEPICYNEGLQEHYYCDKCNKYFSDPAGKLEVTKESLEIPMTLHNIKDGKCTICHGDHNNIVFSEIFDTDDTTIIGYKAIEYKGTNNVILIPSTYLNYPVTTIGRNFTSNDQDIKYLEIPDSINNIEYEALDAGTFDKIKVDDNNKIFDSRNNCNGIIKTSSNKVVKVSNNFIIPNTIASIGTHSFFGNKKIKNLELPESVVTIEGEGFSSFKNVESIKMPDSITYIGTSAFEYCRSLKSIRIPNKITTITDGEFYGCSSLESIILHDGIKTIGIAAFTSCQKLTDIKIPSLIKIINDRTFDNCKSLKNVILPDSLETINRNAFSACTSIKSINIPANVNTISDSSFVECDFETITVEASNNVYSSPLNSNAIIKTDTKELVKGCSKTIIPNDIKIIGNNAFAYCKSLTTIKLPDTLTSIGTSAFSNCLSLNSITFPDALEKIGNLAFKNCVALRSINIPSQVSSIGRRAFHKCNLDTITIDTLNSIYNSNNNCNAIIKTATSTLIQGSNKAFIPEGIKSIESDSFAGCSIIENINIPASVSSIETLVFLGCNLKTITVDPANNNFVSIDGCNAIIDKSNNKLMYGSQNTVIPNTVTEIASNAFQGIKSSSDLVIPASVTKIYSNSLKSSSFNSIKVDPSNKVYDSRDNCNGIIQTNFNILIHGQYNTTFPASLTTIGSGSFIGCIGLNSLEIPGNITLIQGWAFEECEDLVSVIIKNPLQVEDGVFIDCINLRTIVLPKDFKSTVGLFDFCQKLESVFLMDEIDNGKIKSEYPGVTVYTYSESQPTKPGSYWHFVENIPTKW